MTKLSLWIFGLASQLGPRTNRTRQRWEDGSMEIAAPRPQEFAVQSRRLKSSKTNKNRPGSKRAFLSCKLPAASSLNTQQYVLHKKNVSNVTKPTFLFSTTAVELQTSTIPPDSAVTGVMFRKNTASGWRSLTNHATANGSQLGGPLTPVQPLGTYWRQFAIAIILSSQRFPNPMEFESKLFGKTGESY